jgi:KTSC domain
VERQVVDSDNLAALGYDEINGTLEVEFRTGRVYEYYRVPRTVFDELIGSPSKGAYFARNVRDVYRYARVS